MINAVIIDDEKDARFLLRNLLEKKFGKQINVLGEADDVEPGVALIEKHKPDLVFLDIQMKKGTGFDLLKKIKKIDFEVIFITAYNQYAVDAFKFSAFGYLLKPIKSKDLGEVIEKLEKHLSELKQDTTKRLKVLIENYGSDGDIQKLIIPNIEGFQVVKIADIIRLEGDRNYTHFILAPDKKITTSKSLGEYEELLNDHGFFRIHQSTIVSLRHITAYLKEDGGNVKMTDGGVLKISRHRKTEFLERFR
ncbi:MAG: response regulator transcription factor [Crocinitomicaceae bacterium]|nr:LytTR family DNA-binding domain-containing protein [Flavobacteriales bacterium]NQZ34871.1 response regulator transcription factor [Crocinitomicaceae bacterium]